MPQAATRAWLIISALTIASVAAVLLGARMEGAGFWAGAFALALAFVKARQLLDHFLGLRQAGPAWRTTFMVALLVILGGMLLIGVLARL
jgi:hypothetical protein